MTTLLAGDIGGTKTLLSLYGADALELLAQELYFSADWVDLAPMVRHFLDQAEVQAHPRPRAACFAVAGPVHGSQAKLTNLPWQLDESRLAVDCDLERVALVNDFAVLIYCLPHLTPPQRASVRPGEASAGDPVLVLGAGTGLGVAIGLPTDNGLLAMASEAAHGEFAPRSDAEWQLRQWLLDDLGLQRLSIERVVSGTGLGHVARWLMDQEQPASDHPLAVAGRRLQGEESGSEASRSDLPAAVAAAAAAGDPLASRALRLWLGAYGSVTGDLALGCLARGGIWLAGGTAAKQLEGLRSTPFSEAFLAKGRLRSTLEPIPITAILDPAIGSFSAACRARMLLA
ncbi:MAG: glucokinase [Cyanobacteriota bacterium]